MSAGSDRIHQLQTLRFLAAAAVLVGHVFMEMRNEAIGQLPDWFYQLPWASGVDLFFVISGFIIYYISPKDRAGLKTAIDFMIRRIIRIAPIYWFFTLLFILSLMVLGKTASGAELLPEYIVKSFLFIPYAPGDYPMVKPLLGQGWTLNYEMYFYVIAAFALLFLRNRVWIILAILGAAIFTGTLLAPETPVGFFFVNPLLIEFMTGVLLAYYRDRLPEVPGAAALLLSAVALAWLALVPEGDPFNGWDRIVQRGVPMALLFFVFLRLRNPPRFMTTGLLPFLGDASYALYLSHTFAVNAMALIWLKLGLGMPLLYGILTSIVAIIVSVVAYVLLERPMLTWMSARYRDSALRAWLHGARRPEKSVPVGSRW